MKTFAQIISDARQQAQLTQHEVATRVGTSQGHLSRIESGERYADVRTARALIEALELSDGYLMRAVLEQSAAHSGLSLEEFDAILSGPRA